ncbi:MAG: hypothetical protein IKP81_09740 [Paludibacteraceae bacterium]|nr:hypothetical protein [Paludibacteraceae bacterium]
MKKTVLSLFLASIAFFGYAKPDFEIPEVKKYENAEECRKDNDIALKTAKFFFDAKLPEDLPWVKKANAFVLVWLTESDDIMVTIDETRCPFMKCDNKDIRSQMLVAYLSGCVVYCLENKQKEHNFDMHFFALTKTLEYYEKNKSISGSDKFMDKLLNDSKKSSFKAKEQKKFK